MLPDLASGISFIAPGVYANRDTLKVMRKANIGMGANLASRAGAPEETLAAAAVRLASLGRIASRSSLYSTEPVGYAAQPRFVNAAVELQTALTPRQLLNGLLAIEQEFGRDRSAGIANGPRTLDLDILIFDDLRSVSQGWRFRIRDLPSAVCACAAQPDCAPVARSRLWEDDWRVIQSIGRRSPQPI